MVCFIPCILFDLLVHIVHGIAVAPIVIDIGACLCYFSIIIHQITHSLTHSQGTPICTRSSVWQTTEYTNAKLLCDTEFSAVNQSNTSNLATKITIVYNTPYGPFNSFLGFRVRADFGWGAILQMDGHSESALHLGYRSFIVLYIQLDMSLLHH